jgi:hypothetical protein
MALCHAWAGAALEDAGFLPARVGGGIDKSQTGSVSAGLSRMYECEAGVASGRGAAQRFAARYCTCPEVVQPPGRVRVCGALSPSTQTRRARPYSAGAVPLT